MRLRYIIRIRCVSAHLHSPVMIISSGSFSLQCQSMAMCARGKKSEARRMSRLCAAWGKVEEEVGVKRWSTDLPTAPPLEAVHSTSFPSHHTAFSTSHTKHLLPYPRQVLALLDSIHHPWWVLSYGTGSCHQTEPTLFRLTLHLLWYQGG